MRGLLWHRLALHRADAAWGAYSLRGRGQGDATALTAGNLWRAGVLAVLLVLLVLATASGALASGLAAWV